MDWWGGTNNPTDYWGGMKWIKEIGGLLGSVEY